MEHKGASTSVDKSPDPNCGAECPQLAGADRSTIELLKRLHEANGLAKERGQTILDQVAENEVLRKRIAELEDDVRYLRRPQPRIWW